jgi:hypothetical protein
MLAVFYRIKKGRARFVRYIVKALPNLVEYFLLSPVELFYKFALFTLRESTTHRLYSPSPSRRNRH